MDGAGGGTGAEVVTSGREGAASARPGNDHERLWTPWRMRYVGGQIEEPGCVFCNRLAADDDVASLIVLRGERAFAIMNLFPYNTGHLMLVPNAHLASPELLDPATTGELAAMVGPALRAIRRALGCHGFNLGLNVGAVAGAGVADHLHQHLVPRWQGDANFMPILAGTMVLPELIPVTYAKLRGELLREATRAAAVVCLAVSGPPGEEQVLARAGDDDAPLPRATAGDEEPLWRAAVRVVEQATGGRPEIAGWAGPDRASATGPAAVTLLLPEATATAAGAGATWMPAAEALAGTDGTTVAAGLRNLGRTEAAR